MKKVLLISAATGLGIRLVLTWTGIAETSPLLADDAYYYFTIARNIAHGLGSTFDGLSPTNGYHPLWMLIVTSIFMIAKHSLWLPVGLVLSFASVLDVLSGLWIYFIMKRCGLEKEGVVGAAVWFLSPLTVFLSMRGMESAISTVLVLSFVYYLLMADVSDRAFRVGIAVGSGALLGLAGLARTDNLLFLAAVSAVFCFAASREAHVTLLRRLRYLLTMGAAALAVVSPWFIWNLVKFGSIIQVSGAAKTLSNLIYGGLRHDYGRIIGIIETVVYPTFGPIVLPVRYTTGEEWTYPYLATAMIVLTIPIVVYPILKLQRGLFSSVFNSRAKMLVLMAGTYMVLHTLMYGFILRFYANWYPSTYLAFIAMLIGACGVALFRIKASRSVVATLVTLALAVQVVVYASFFMRYSPEIFHKIRRIDDLTKIESSYSRHVTVGAFNAGAIGYTAIEFPKVTVVNLDCLVNNEAFRAVKENRYFDYVVGTIDVMLENPDGVAMFLDKQETDSLCALYKRWPGPLAIYSKTRP